MLASPRIHFAGNVTPVNRVDDLHHVRDFVIFHFQVGPGRGPAARGGRRKLVVRNCLSQWREFRLPRIQTFQSNASN